MHGDMVAPAGDATSRPSRARSAAADHEPRRSSTCATPTATETPQRQLRRVHGHTAPKFECSFAPTLRRVPAADPGLPRRVVRRLQHHLHAHPADQRQVLHRGGLVGRRRLVQGRRQGRRRGAVPVQGPEGRRRLHVPGRPQRARDRGHHRAGAGAPGRSRAHDQPARHHVPDHLHRLRWASSNADSAVTGDRCDRPTQNSYQMMKKALGDWPGGPKPSAFGCIEDTQAPTVRFLTPGDGAQQGPRLHGEGRRARRLRRQEGRDQGDAAGLVGGRDARRPTSGT